MGVGGGVESIKDNSYFLAQVAGMMMMGSSMEVS